MSSIKKQMIKVIDQQPEDSTYVEILRELAFLKMVRNGLKDTEANRTITNEEMQRKIKQWDK